MKKPKPQCLIRYKNGVDIYSDHVYDSLEDCITTLRDDGIDDEEIEDDFVFYELGAVKKVIFPKDNFKVVNV